MDPILLLGRAAAVAALTALTLPAAWADPASSGQSAWTDLALRPDPGLADPAVRRGREVFEARCQACHGVAPPVTGTATPGGLQGMPPFPGTAALEARYKGAKPAALERRTDLTPEFIETLVRNGRGIMPPFRPTEVSGDDLTALEAYLTRKRP